MEKTMLELCRAKDYSSVRKMLAEMHVVDIAEELAEMEDEALVVLIFRMMPKSKAAEVFAYLDRETQQNIVKAITDSEIGGIIESLFLDDAVDFVEEMPANVVKRVLAAVSPDRRRQINHFLQYPEDSAGSVMTIEYVALKVGTTVSDAFRIIRQTGVDKETIYTCYVIDRDRKLLGAVSVRTLLLANQDELVDDIMQRSIIFANTDDDQESLTNTFRKYGLLAIPVVDHENRLVGIVTVDDALTVQEEEATEDFEIMAAISPSSEEPYLKTSVFLLAKRRVFWLMLLMLSATVTGAIITRFEDALATLPALVSFIPMLMDTGGNAGAQSSTLVIRGMALEEIETSDILHVLRKELGVAALCGGALVIVNFLRVLLMGSNVILSATVSLALYATVITAKSVGCLLPIIAKKLKLDPAVMAAPIITTIVDAAALLIYFALAKALLGI